MNCIVTGGAGFIGSHLVDCLLKRRNTVVIIDDFSNVGKENIEHNLNNPNLKVIHKNINDNLEEIFSEKIDVIFHLAALPRVQFSIENPIETHNVNVNGTLNLLNCCRLFKVKRFVFSSSSSVYGDQKEIPTKESMGLNPLSPYGMHKLIGENYCNLFHKIYGIETIILRYFNVYGPRMNPNGAYALVVGKFIKLISNGQKVIINGDGEQTRDFTYVSDVVEANLLASVLSNANCFGEAFNIGAGKNISVNKIFKKINEFFKGNNAPEYGKEVLEPKHTLADNTKARELLNWLPKIDFDKGIKLTLQQYL